MKKILGFSKRGIRALLVPLAAYLLLKLVFDVFAKISFAIFPQNNAINTLIDLAIWFSLTVGIGAIISNRTIRKAIWKWADHKIHPRCYLAAKYFLGSDEEQEVEYQEVLFEMVPGDWKLGMQMSTFNVKIGGTLTKFSIILEPSAPVSLTGTLHLRKTSDAIPTGRTIISAALTAASLGIKFNINPNLELQRTKDA